MGGWVGGREGRTLGLEVQGDEFESAHAGFETGLIEEIVHTVKQRAVLLPVQTQAAHVLFVVGGWVGEMEENEAWTLWVGGWVSLPPGSPGRSHPSRRRSTHELLAGALGFLAR